MPATARRPLHLVPPLAAGPSEPPPAQVGERALIAGILARDPAASTPFYERVRPLIDRVLTRLLGHHDADYEDVAQVALFEVVETLDRFRGECPFSAWVSVVTARSVFRQIRRRRLERRVFARAPLEDSSTLLGVAPAAFASREALAIVRAHLLKMDERRAMTFFMHDVEGYSLQEISEITGASVAAAQSRLVRGRHELHARLEREPGLSPLRYTFSEDST